MNKTVYEAGILVVVFAVFAVSSAVALPIPPGKVVIVWFEPDPSIALPGENITVQMWMNTSVDLGGWADGKLYFDPEVVNITEADFTGAAFPDETVWSHWGNYVRIAGMDENLCEQTHGELLMVTLTLHAKSPGTSQLYHDPDWTEMFDCDGNYVPTEWVHGNFTCLAPPETFSKSLVKGWNLISLPLTNDTDMTVANIMSSVNGSYDALYRYDASTKKWVALGSDDTMENGVGYFIHMTEDATWTYSGSAFTSMSISLEQGLNMIGWLNCSKPINQTGLDDPAKVRYIARWNATSHKFEVYVPGAPSVFNDFDTLERGVGYFVAAKTDFTLTESCT